MNFQILSEGNRTLRSAIPAVRRLVSGAAKSLIAAI
jgi:hypothetical protein